MTKSKHVPLRTCVGCGESKPKMMLTRIVDAEGGPVMDETGKAHGRGAYICKSGDCLEMAFKRNGFKRSFKRNISKEELEGLKEVLTSK